VREAWEELGIRVEQAELRFTTKHLSEKSRYFQGFHYEILSYEGEPFNKEPEKHSGLQWFSKLTLIAQEITKNHHVMHAFKSGLYDI